MSVFTAKFEEGNWMLKLWYLLHMLPTLSPPMQNLILLDGRLSKETMIC